MNKSVYAPPQFNQGLDTDDLIVMKQYNSQYNPMDFDPEWENKEKAKFKVYANVQMQTEIIESRKIEDDKSKSED